MTFCLDKRNSARELQYEQNSRINSTGAQPASYHKGTTTSFVGAMASIQNDVHSFWHVVCYSIEPQVENTNKNDLLAEGRFSFSLYVRNSATKLNWVAVFSYLKCRLISLLQLRNVGVSGRYKFYKHTLTLARLRKSSITTELLCMQSSTTERNAPQKGI